MGGDYGKSWKKITNVRLLFLQNVVAVGITLDSEVFYKEIKFLGQLVHSQGVHADPSKIKA